MRLHQPWPSNVGCTARRFHATRVSIVPEIVDEAGEKIGVITSGCPSPALKKNIAMGYIKDGLHKSGTEVEVVIRGKKRKAKVAKMPFIPSKYFKAPTTK